MQFWDVASGKRIERTPPIAKPSANNLPMLSQLKPSPDGRFVAVCDNLGVMVWDRTSKSWAQGPQTTPTERYVAWMPDSRSLWLGSNNFPGAVQNQNNLQELSVPELKTMRTLPGVGPLAIAGDGRTLATRDNAGKGVWLWNIE